MGGQGSAKLKGSPTFENISSIHLPHWKIIAQDQPRRTRNAFSAYCVRPTKNRQSFNLKGKAIDGPRKTCCIKNKKPLLTSDNNQRKPSKLIRLLTVFLLGRTLARAK